MEFTKNGCIRPGGELDARCGLLLSRLGEHDYSADEVFSEKCINGWPGDWAGRAILGQTLLARTTGRTAANLSAIIEKLPSELNERGYLGEICPDGVINEQQLSGHSWLLRGLCEYYYYTGDEGIKETALRIARNLFLPAREHYRNYPLDRDSGGGDMSGSIAGTVNGWMLSTDTGCAYIGLDGISAVYEMSGDSEIGSLALEMAEQFSKIDIVGIKAQTHASLTAARGILRLYSATKERWLLNTAERVFGQYIECGMTPAYENYNWFGRPEWTEPCAVIDSFIVAMQLYLYTVRADYIDYAQRILYNGIFGEQRANGGFGCNSCVTDGTIKTHCYEASWCCTMRGGEGLSRAVQYSYIVSGNRIIIPYLTDSEADIEVNGCSLHITQTTSYPYEGKATFDVEGLTDDSDVVLVIYQPRENEYYTEKLTPDNCHIDINFVIPLVVSNEEGGKRYSHGNLILGCPDGESPDFGHIISRGRGVYFCGDVRMAPLGSNWKSTKEKIEKLSTRILF